MFRALLVTSLLVCISGGTLKSSEQNTRIVGGIETTIDRFPYIVSFQYLQVHRCAGIIYRFDVIVLSASCLIGLNINNMQIVGGSAHRYEGGITRVVKEVRIHDDYDAWTNNYDIALIVVDKPFVYTSTMHAIPFANQDEDLPAGIRVLIAGWGSLTESGTSQNVLHYADLHVIDRQTCAARYEIFSRNVTDLMICAGDSIGHRGVCYGDYGGPMIVENRLYGIISWGAGCADKVYPAVFTRVSMFREWITFKLSLISKN